ncbi:uncharacterized protein LOC119745157 [Patiria miniata]|uniref:Reverse transcriptase domain-containing protein n=1 Tax=Patiria miniata TaxID=46514 RepID=A0A914BMY5_PATMI|nr:uncharacterized protein LOC119745157 [Patiria miniata]
MDKNVPTNCLKGRWDLPWMTPEIKRLMRRRKRRYATYKKFKTQKNWTKYTTLHTQIKQKLNESHTNYINGMFENEESAPKDCGTPVLRIVYQQSLDTGDIPDDWKQANVTAVFKKGDRSQPSNCRPVSLTSIACKVLEHIIASNIRAHLDHHHILNDFQHGFRKHHSCETQLLTTLDDLTGAIDQKQQIDCLILDFSKAFDVLAHGRLLYKLGWYGINGPTNKWIGSWLTNRTQAVVVDGERSCQVLLAPHHQATQQNQLNL